ncbi:MAG: hypothetical protein AAF809_08280 [Bacteroidota bacterium]
MRSLSPFLSRLSVAACLLVLAAAPALAQGLNNYGTLYSRFGVGERLLFSTSQTEAMGGAGVALRSFSYASLDNPAAWGDIALTHFTFGASVTGTSVEAADGTTSDLASGGLSTIQIAFPLRQQKLGLNIAYRPYSRVNYRAVQTESFLPSDGGGAIDYRINYEGEGGLQEIQAGLGYRLSPNVLIGGSINALFGTVDYLQRTEFPGSVGFVETRSTESVRVAGVTGTAGVIASVPRLLGEADVLAFGATLRLPARLFGERALTIGQSLDRDTLATETDGSLRLPMEVAAGISYQPTRSLRLAVDTRYEPWGSQFESDFALGGFTPGGETILSDRFRVGGGLEWRPAGARRRAPYLSRVAYRLGGYVDNGYLAPEGTDLTTYAATAGLSLPALIPTASFDLNVEVGQRGDATGLLVRDTFVKASATINFGERWFQRRRLD